MWQCDNCGYTDEDGKTFEEEAAADRKEVVKDKSAEEESVRYCPECGSDEVFLVDEEEDAELYEEKLAEDDEDDDEELLLRR